MKQTRYLLLLLAMLMLPQLQTAMYASVVGDVDMDGFTFRLYKETNHNYALLVKPADSYIDGNLTLSSSKVTYNSTSYFIEGISSNAFKNKNDLGVIDLRKATSLTYVGSSAFSTTTFSTNGTVLLPTSCTELKSSAFTGSNISSLDLSNVTTIGSSCFSYTTKLETLSLPKVTALPGSAFSDSNIKNLDAPLATSVGSYCFLRAKQLRTIDLPQLVTIDSQAFSSSGLCQIVLPSTVTSIGFAAFANCPELHTVVSKISDPFDAATNMFGPADDCTLVVPSGATSKYNNKGWSAFFNTVKSSMSGCILSDGDLLYRVNPNNLSTLYITGQSAYSESNIIQKTFSPTAGSDSFTFNGTTYICWGIDSYAFQNNTKLFMFTINPGGTAFAVGMNAFTGSTVKLVSFCPDSQYDCPVTLFPYAFYNSKELIWVYGSPSGISVGTEAFLGCDNLNTVSNLSNVGQRAFYNTNLVNVSFTNNTTTLDQNAFSGTKITSLELPASLQTMNSPVFANCYDLVDVTANMTNPFELSSEEFAEMAKWESDQSILHIPSGTRQKYVDKKWIERFALDVTLEDGLQGLELHDDYVYYYITEEGIGSTGKCVISRPRSSSTTNVVIENSSFKKAGKYYHIRGISNGAFKNSNLESFKMNYAQYLYSIGTEAFAGSTKLKEAYFGDNSIAVIGEKAFQGCSSLKYFILPKDASDVGDYAFSGLTGLGRFQVEFSEPGLFLFNGTVFDNTPIEKIPLYLPSESVYKFLTSHSSYYPWTFFKELLNTSHGRTFSDGVFNYTVLEGDAGYDKKWLGITGRSANNQASLLSLPQGHYEVDGVEYPVRIIDEEAFSGDQLLKTIDLSMAEGRIEVWNEAFANCSNLERLISNPYHGWIPKLIHEYVHYVYSSPWSYTHYDSCQFKGSGIKEIDLSSDVPEQAFMDCPRLKKVTFSLMPDNITCFSFGKEAFANCTSLTDLHLPDQTDRFFIDENAFNGSGLKNVVIPDYNSFTLRANAFNGADQMKQLKTYISNPTDLDENAFTGIGADCVLWIPDNQSYYNYHLLSGWRYFFDNNKFKCLDSIPTGVDKVAEDGTEKVYYNLQGQRVEHPQPGSIYVVNGKKVRY